MDDVRRKSSYSGGGGGNCVAVGSRAGSVVVEDTKQDSKPLARRDRLTVPPTAWRTFLAALK
jgi:hypothetical protein